MTVSISKVISSIKKTNEYKFVTEKSSINSTEVTIRVLTVSVNCTGVGFLPTKKASTINRLNTNNPNFKKLINSGYMAICADQPKELIVTIPKI